jgi:lysophospholipase L1-like esterase
MSDTPRAPSRAVLCFGDSNTWGYLVEGAPRMTRWERWPGILQLELGEDVHVIEEGLNGRTTAFEDPYRPGRHGLAALPMLLDTHAPLDAVVIMLGTNDLFVPGDLNAFHAARGVRAMVELIRAREPVAGDVPAILVLAPPPFGPIGPWEAESPRAREASERFGEAFRRLADELDVPLVDLAEHVASSPRDGIHFEVADHAVIGRAVADALRPLLAR